MILTGRPLLDYLNVEINYTYLKKTLVFIKIIFEYKSTLLTNSGIAQIMTGSLICSMCIKQSGPQEHVVYNALKLILKN